MTIANGVEDAADVEELIARIVRKKFPALALLNVRTYRVVNVYNDAPNYGRCDIALESDPEQQIPRVDQWPGIAGGVCLPAVGSLVEVAWRDGDQKSPIIVGFQHTRLTGGIPNVVKINASALIEFGGAGATALALAAQTTANFNTLKSAITNATTTAGDGGAAFKSAIVSALSSFPAALATTKVKGV